MSSGKVHGRKVERDEEWPEAKEGCAPRSEAERSKQAVSLNVAHYGQS